jgi:hypothetical protein
MRRDASALEISGSNGSFASCSLVGGDEVEHRGVELLGELELERVRATFDHSELGARDLGRELLLLPARQQDVGKRRSG